MRNDIVIPVPPAPRPTTADLRHYARALGKRRWPLLAFVSLAAIASSWYALTATPIYRASASLLIEPHRSNVVSIEELVGIETDSPDYYQTQLELLRSRSLAKKVIGALDLWDDPELAPGAAPSGPVGYLGRSLSGLLGGARPDGAAPEGGAPADGAAAAAAPAVAPSAATDTDAAFEYEAAERERVVDRFLQRLIIRQKQGTKLVSLSYESRDPVLAADIANTLAEQYITSYLDTRLARTARATEWLGGRVAELDRALDESERRLLEFKRENGLVDVDGSVGRLNEQQLLLATVELDSARSEAANARDAYRRMRSLEGRDQMLTLSAAQTDPLVQRAKVEEAEATAELETLLNRYGTRHPRVLDAQSAVDSARIELDAQLQRISGSIEREYESARERLAAVEAKLSAGKEEVQSLGAKRFELEALEREVQTNLEIYQTFYNRMTEARSANGLEEANASVADRAVPPAESVKPKGVLIVLLSVLGALAVGVLATLAKEYFDDAINNLSDLERELETPSLGILPAVRRPLSRRARAAPVQPDGAAGGAFVEAVGAIRTTLSLTDGERRKQVIAVTSSVPGEGKSSLSLNLAHSFGQMEKVLLIDGDMRRPTLLRGSKRSAGRERYGLSTLVAGIYDLEACLSVGRWGGTVDVLTAGPVPDSPLELLSSPRFERLLLELRERYDRIVIDSAPIRAVSDALVIAKASDAVIYVVKAHDTPAEMARRGLQRLEELNAPVAGVVLAQLEARRAGTSEGNYRYDAYYRAAESRGKRGEDVRLVLSPAQLEAIRTDGSETAPTAGTGGAERDESSGGRSRSRRSRSNELDIL